MPKYLRIVTSSFGTFEAITPPYNLREPNPEENIERAISILDTAKSFNPDLVLLPETFKMAGIGSANIKEIAEPLSGPTVHLLAYQARQGNFNLIAGHILDNENGQLTNSALVFDRHGNLAGKYDKNFPVKSEINSGITPGKDLPLFHLDCGRIGVLICFDINWPTLWSQIAVAGADLIGWISAYEGGFPLKAYAWTNRVPIVTSVMPYHGRVIDITGEIVASTSRWNRIAAFTLNLDRDLFHTDNQMNKILDIQKKYGPELIVKTYTEEHWILIENNVPGKTINDIAQEFELLSYRDYVARSTCFRNARIT